MRTALALGAATLLLAGVTAANTAQAQTVSISIDSPHWGVRIGTPPPVYAPAPVVVVPAPVYPRPVVVAPVPVVLAPPVVYAPPRAVVVPAPFWYGVPVYGPPMYGPPGHRHKHKHFRRHVRD